MTQVDTSQWITVQEASQITGKSINSLRLLIRRKKLSRVLKVKGKHGDEWVIHKEAIHDLSQGDQGMTPVNDQPHDQGSQVNPGDMTQVITLPSGIYLQQQKERDELLQGMMMYRYKFEELDRQIRLLPAPVEIIPARISELEAKSAESAAQAAEDRQALARSQEAVKALEEALQRERQRTWWDRLWKR